MHRSAAAAAADTVIAGLKVHSRRAVLEEAIRVAEATRAEAVATLAAVVAIPAAAAVIPAAVEVTRAAVDRTYPYRRDRLPMKVNT
jgi:hypothetical protein